MRRVKFTIKNHEYASYVALWKAPVHQTSKDLSNRRKMYETSTESTENSLKLKQNSTDLPNVERAGTMHKRLQLVFISTGVSISFVKNKSKRFFVNTSSLHLNLYTRSVHISLNFPEVANIGERLPIASEITGTYSNP